MLTITNRARISNFQGLTLKMYPKCTQLLKLCTQLGTNLGTNWVHLCGELSDLTFQRFRPLNGLHIENFRSKMKISIPKGIHFIKIHIKICKILVKMIIQGLRVLWLSGVFGRSLTQGYDSKTKVLEFPIFRDSPSMYLNFKTMYLMYLIKVHLRYI